MCGINGIFAYHYAANPIDRDELIRTRDHMAARGPDAEGDWLSGDRRIGLGHRRLSIIDLSDAGAQPMLSADGRFAVTFNGEIYNHRELRRGLEERGHLFHSQSDTEVLLHLYAEKGAEMVHDVRGMFAFAIWDAQRRALFLARDPYGIKPLYYADDGWTFRFASQVKALLEGRGVSRDLEPAGLVGFTCGATCQNLLLPIARYVRCRCTMVVDSVGAHQPKRYQGIGQIYKEAEDLGPSALSAGNATEIIREALLDSLRHHLGADVPVGVFLSAGVDSASLVGLMRDVGQSDIETVTIGFGEFLGTANDECPLATDVARLYGTKHSVRIITEQEFRADLPLILGAMDQPSIDGINAWFVSKAAHEIGLKVAISGLGGDELFGGYSSFEQVPKWTRRVGLASQIPFLGRLIRKVVSGVEPTDGRLAPKWQACWKWEAPTPAAITCGVVFSCRGSLHGC